MSIYGCVLGLAGLCIFGALLNGNTHFIPYILLGGAVLLLVVYILERISPTPPPSDPTPPYQPPKPPSVKDATRNSEPADFTQKPYTPPSPMDFTIRVANAKSGIREETVDVRRAPVSEVTEASASNVFSAPEQRVRKEDFEIKNSALIKYKGNESHVTVPDGVERICTYAFTEIEKFMVWVGRPGDEGVVTHEIERPMDYVREVVLPDSVSHIEGRAFAWCENLESVRFGKNIRVIEKGAFDLCGKLKQVIVPEHAQISEGAFDGATEIIRVPKEEL